MALRTSALLNIDRPLKTIAITMISPVEKGGCTSRELACFSMSFATWASSDISCSLVQPSDRLGASVAMFGQLWLLSDASTWCPPGTGWCDEDDVVVVQQVSGKVKKQRQQFYCMCDWHSLLHLRGLADQMQLAPSTSELELHRALLCPCVQAIHTADRLIVSSLRSPSCHQ